MPIRTCVGCRRKDDQKEMVRVVADEAGRIRINDSRREPGRGAYLHDDPRCVEETVTRGALQRALKRRLVPVAGDELSRRVHEAASRQGLKKAVAAE
jgi:predicted RNA-binding protein YlxR (DUF448 family)